MSEGGEVPKEKIIKKVECFCPHCKQKIYIEKVNTPNLDRKLSDLQYLEDRVSKIAERVHSAIYTIQKTFRETNKELDDVKIQLQILEGEEPCR